jgi:hypothetical protein
MLLGVAFAANYGPLRAYNDARDRFENARTEVAALEKQKADLQEQLGKLTEAGYLESLARQELTYARPGEELYIITDSPEGDTATSATTGSDTTESAATKSIIDDDAATESVGSAATSEGQTTETTERPGLFERMLAGFIGLF